MLVPLADPYLLVLTQRHQGHHIRHQENDSGDPETSWIHKSSCTSRSRGYQWTVNSTQILFFAFFLFLLTALLAYLKPSQSQLITDDEALQTLSTMDGSEHVDIFVSFSGNVAYSIIDVLTKPLITLSCIVTMVGLLCRGAERVIEYSAFKARWQG